MLAEHFEVALHKNRSWTQKPVVQRYGFWSAMIHLCVCANVEVYIYLFTFPLQEPTMTERMPFTPCNNKPWFQISILTLFYTYRSVYDPVASYVVWDSVKQLYCSYQIIQPFVSDVMILEWLSSYPVDSLLVNDDTFELAEVAWAPYSEYRVWKLTEL